MDIPVQFDMPRIRGDGEIGSSSKTQSLAGSTIDLTLRYTHALGALVPYFEGLTAGRAVASVCAACGRTWFPPRPGCCSRAGPVQWTTLAGTGYVVAATNGGGTLPFGGGPAGEGLALIALDGADNLALGWVDGFGGEPPEGARVRLVASDRQMPHPAQAAWYVPEGVAARPGGDLDSDTASTKEKSST